MARLRRLVRRHETLIQAALIAVLVVSVTLA